MKFGVERLAHPDTIIVELPEGASLTQEQVRQALIDVLNRNFPVLADGLPALGEVVACRLRFDASITNCGTFVFDTSGASVENGVLEVRLFPQAATASGAELEAGLEGAMPGKLRQPDDLAHLAADIRSQRQIARSLAPHWDELLAGVDAPWAREVLAAREVNLGAPVEENRNSLERLAAALEQDTMEAFYEDTKTNPLFAARADAKFHRQDLISAIDKLGLTGSPGLRPGTEKSFEKYIISIGAANPMLQSTARPQLFALYRRYYQLARKLGDTNVEAARRAVQFVDLDLKEAYETYQVHYAAGNREAIAKTLLKKLEEKTSSPGTLLAGCDEDQVKITFLLLKLQQIFVGTLDVGAKKIAELISAEDLARVISVACLNLFFAPRLPALLRQLPVPYLRELQAALKAGSSGAAAQVFNALLFAQDAGDEKTAVVKEMIATTPDDVLACWAMQPERGSALEDALLVALLNEGSVRTGAPSEFCRRTAAAVMRRFGPESFAIWSAVAWSAHDLLGAGQLAAIVTEEAMFEVARFWYFQGRGYVRERGAVGDALTAIVRAEKSKEDKYQEAMALIKAQPEDRQLHLLFDLLAHDACFLVNMLLAQDRSQVVRMIPFIDAKLVLTNLLKPLLASDYNIETLAAELSSLDAGLRLSALFDYPLRTSHNTGADVFSPRLAILQRRAIMEASPEQGAKWFQSGLASLEIGSLIDRDVLTVGQIRQLRLDLDFAHSRVLFQHLSDEQAVEVFDEAAGQALAQYYYNEAETGITSSQFGISLNSNLVSESMLRVARIFPEARRTLFRRFVRLLHDATAHPGEGKGFSPPLLVFATQHITQMTKTGLGDVLRKKASQHLLFLFAACFEPEKGQAQLHRSRLARQLGLSGDISTISSPPEVRNALAGNYYRALRSLGRVIQPFPAKGVRVETARVAGYALGYDKLWNEGDTLPKYLRVMDEGKCYEVDLLSGKCRLVEDEFIMERPQIYYAAQENDPQLFAKMDILFAEQIATLDPKARRSLVDLERFIGSALRELKPSTVSADMVRWRLTQLILVNTPTSAQAKDLVRRLRGLYGEQRQVLCGLERLLEELARYIDDDYVWTDYFRMFGDLRTAEAGQALLRIYRQGKIPLAGRYYHEEASEPVKGLLTAAVTCGTGTIIAQHLFARLGRSQNALKAIASALEWALPRDTDKEDPAVNRAVKEVILSFGQEQQREMYRFARQTSVGSLQAAWRQIWREVKGTWGTDESPA